MWFLGLGLIVLLLVWVIWDVLRGFEVGFFCFLGGWRGDGRMGGWLTICLPECSGFLGYRLKRKKVEK